MGDASQPQTSSLPTPQLDVVHDGIWRLLPLSRKGSGPGLIVLTPTDHSQEQDLTIKNGIPSPLLKWAEESYTVVQIKSHVLRSNHEAFDLAIEALDSCPLVEDKGRYGLVAYDAVAFTQYKSQIESIPQIVGAVVYTDSQIGHIDTKTATVQHLAGKTESKLPRTQHLTVHTYPSAKSTDFALPSSPNYDYAQEAVSHTRSLTFLKHHTIIGGPIFDLEAIWDEHTYYEFEDRNVAKTMATMVQEPYVNHIPTMTGGIGRDRLTNFYTHHFIFSNPDGTELELISRTVGVDRVVDEFIFKFTHNRAVDWMLPGVPPTNCKVEAPMMAVVNIRGDRLYHEHIHWDQATVLRQIGLLPKHLAWPASLGAPGSEYVEKQEGLSAGKELVARLPVAGIEAAGKLRDKNEGESNAMFSYKLSYAS